MGEKHVLGLLTSEVCFFFASMRLSLKCSGNRAGTISRKQAMKLSCWSVSFCNFSLHVFKLGLCNSTFLNRIWVFPLLGTKIKGFEVPISRLPNVGCLRIPTARPARPQQSSHFRATCPCHRHNCDINFLGLNCWSSAGTRPGPQNIGIKCPKMQGFASPGFAPNCERLVFCCGSESQKNHAGAAFAPEGPGAFHFCHSEMVKITHSMGCMKIAHPGRLRCATNPWVGVRWKNTFRPAVRFHPVCNERNSFHSSNGQAPQFQLLVCLKPLSLTLDLD